MDIVRALIVPLALVVATVTAPVPAVRAASAPDAGKVFIPTPRSQPLFGTKAPSEDPERQQHYVEGHDGTQLYVETWLPAPKDGKKPPKKVPTILIMTPYVSQGVEEYPTGSSPGFIDYMTARGYAVAQTHVRGTGESGGCLEQTAANQIDDGARVVRYLGSQAPWSSGRVGMYGISYDAETQISVAGLGDPKMTKYLKAIVPAASVGGQYEYSFFDGVPYGGQALLSNTSYLGAVSAVPGQQPAPQHYPEKLECQGDVMASSADQSGDMTPFWKAREYRPGAPKVKAATLYVHGLRDFNVQPITIAGWFDRLPASTPHKGIFGVWNHAFPSSHGSVEPTWARADWYDTVTAWYDRYLKGLDTGVEEWPDVQVQDSTGQWRVEREFPTTGGPVGQLALGPEGTLGVTEPEGSTAYREGLDAGQSVANEQVVFETGSLPAALRIAGQPVLDLWLTTDQPDGHIASKIEVIGPDGEVMTHEGSSGESMATYGFRSLRHLKPLKHNHFMQAEGIAPPVNEPIRVPVRFHPTDLVVPEGGSLRVTVAGSIAYSRNSLPSGMAPTITLLHDCDHPSALRFLMPSRRAKLLNVRETDEQEKLKPGPSPRLDIDGGLAQNSVCGLEPIRLSTFKSPR